MLTYLVRRMLLVLVVIVGVSIATLIIMDVLPGDFFTRFALSANQETLDLLRAEYGLDKPWIVQYWTWLSQIVTKGTLGFP